MAFDGTYTYYNDGYGGTGTIYKLDSTGAIVGSFTPPGGDLFGGLAYLNGKLYADTPDSATIDIFDATTFASLGSINIGEALPWVGLAGDPDRDVLWAVAQAPGTLAEIDPSTGAIIKQGPDHSQGLYEQDIAYANGQLIVSDTSGGDGAGNNFLDEYDPNTLGFLQRIAPPYTYAASGLAGDGLGGVSTDWYQFNVNAGDNLVITTTTPGGSTASGLQFINDLDPTLNLYDASGNLVATATGNAADGRNDVIDWTALTPGSYRVQILGASKTNLGEYTIGIQGATGGPAPFTVTATNPAAGSDIGYQVSSMTVSVSDSILLSSVSPSDFTIDGNTATGVAVIDGQDLSFTFPTTADGIHSVSIGGLVDIHGVALTPDNFSFQTDDVPPVVVSSSIANGAVLAHRQRHRGRHVQQADSAVIGQHVRHFALRRDPRHQLHALVQLRPDRHDPDDQLLEPTHRRLPIRADRRARQLPQRRGRAASERLRGQLHHRGGHKQLDRLAAGPSAGQSGLSDHGRQCSRGLDRCRHVQPRHRSPPDSLGDRDPRVVGHDGDRDPDLAQGHRDRHGDVAQPGHSGRLPAVQAPTAGPTSSRSPAGRVNTRSSRS